MTCASIFARIVNTLNSLPNLVVDANTVNASKAWLDKFWSHQAVKCDFTADFTGTGKLETDQKKLQIDKVIIYK